MILLLLITVYCIYFGSSFLSILIVIIFTERKRPGDAFSPDQFPLAKSSVLWKRVRNIVLIETRGVNCAAGLFQLEFDLEGFPFLDCARIRVAVGETRFDGDRAFRRVPQNVTLDDEGPFRRGEELSLCLGRAAIGE